LAAWIPIWLIKFISSCIFPSEVDKLEKANKNRELNQQDIEEKKNLVLFKTFDDDLILR